MGTFSFIKMFISAIFTLIKNLTFLLIPFGFAIFVFLVSCFLWYCYYRFVVHVDIKHKEPSTFEKQNIFKTLFWLFPKQFVHDQLTLDPSHFQNTGIHIVVGEQGSGKTMTAVYLLEKWKCDFPRLKVYTNMGYKYEDDNLDNLDDLVQRNNNEFGVVNVIDEIHSWFSSKDRNAVPVYVLGDISQQRKQRKAIIGTVQVFSELSKSFRTQTQHVYVPKTFLGCLTIVKCTKAKYYDPQTDTFRKYNGFFIYAHTKKLRESYDTFKRIEKYKSKDFALPNSSLFNEASGLPMSDDVVPLAVDKKVAQKLLR